MKEKKDMNRKRAIRARQRKQRNRRIALVLCVMFAVLAVSVGGTMAWLMDKTDSVTNTFTVGDINIDLTETTGSAYKIIPGSDIDKDPKVTVTAGSEDCWLFVKVDGWGKIPANWNNSIATGWTELADASTATSKVYWRKVGANAIADQTFSVIEGDTIKVPDTATKADLKALGNFDVTFTAYAVQQENVATVAAAWELVKPNPTGA